MMTVVVPATVTATVIVVVAIKETGYNYSECESLCN